MSFHINVIVKCQFCKRVLGTVSVSRYTRDNMPVEVEIEPCGDCSPQSNAEESQSLHTTGKAENGEA